MQLQTMVFFFSSTCERDGGAYIILSIHTMK
jgi:hypothetical protein